MAGPVCNLPPYYEMVKALAFISSFGFGACTAASLQVAMSEHPIGNPEPPENRDASIVRAGSRVPSFLRTITKKAIHEIRLYTRSPSILFAIASSLYGVGLILSLPLNLLLTWQPAARAAGQGGIVHSLVVANVYIAVVSVVAGAVITGHALKSIKPIVGWITLSAVVFVALTFLVILIRLHTNSAWNDPEPRICVWYDGV